MSLKKRDYPTLSRTDFLNEFMRLRRGSVTRRHFLRVTGLCFAAAVSAAFSPRQSFAVQPKPGSVVSLATWPNYHSPDVLQAFTNSTGIAIELDVFGSNEEMLSRLRTGRAKWDLFIPTNYTISTYEELGLIDRLDRSKLPNLDMNTQNPRFTAPGLVDSQIYAVPRNWGTTGMAYNTRRLSSRPRTWKDFFELAATEAHGRTIVHDYQLTTVGNALVSLGYSFNSVDPVELAEAEKVLMALKPHLYAIDSDYQAPMRAGDAWLTMCWSNDAAQLTRDVSDIRYKLGEDGGEIWTDFYAIPKNAPRKDAGYALLDFFLAPAIGAVEFATNGAGVTDSRILGLLPRDVVRNSISYPDDTALTPLELGAAVTLPDGSRQELMERFRAA